MSRERDFYRKMKDAKDDPYLNVWWVLNREILAVSKRDSSLGIGDTIVISLQHVLG